MEVSGQPVERAPEGSTRLGGPHSQSGYFKEAQHLLPVGNQTLHWIQFHVATIYIASCPRQLKSSSTLLRASNLLSLSCFHTHF